MLTIQQTVTIPADRRIVFDLPDTVPSGKSYVTVTFSPTEVQNDSAFPSAEALEIEASQKAAAAETNGSDPLVAWRDSLNGEKVFDGIDGLLYQKKIRGEW
ncbi:MAG: hypothetical protein Ta2A_16220 [Treponemataceae bacterium]|nr:MAG: hypothetical protein Ta2A_16220 [Treponemataceae bacterium]